MRFFSYLVGSRPDERITAKVAADVGGDHFSVYAITRDEVDILTRRALLGVGLAARGFSSSCHGRVLCVRMCAKWG